MTKGRRDGLYLLILGIGIFISFGFVLLFTAKDSMGDFKGTYYPTRCLLHQCDPYNESEYLLNYQSERRHLDAFESRRGLVLTVNLPSTFLLIAPLAMLPYGLAAAVWMILTAVSLVLAACLTWDLAANYAPTLSAGLIAFLLTSSAIVLANGNSAGIVVGFCVIAVWCFLKERFVLAGILCLGIILAIKPHDAGLIWLFFLLAGGVFRKRALQTLVVTIVLGLAAFLWVSHVAPHWIPEMRANMEARSSQGGNDDPGPAGMTSTSKTMDTIIDLQAVISIFRDDPRFYDPVTYLFCGVLVLIWGTITIRSRTSPALTWFALATAAPLSMLVTYHRAYDAKMLLLTVPACALLWTEGGIKGRFALLVSALGFFFTGEIPLAFLLPLTRSLHLNSTSFFGEIETVLLSRPASLSLLAMTAFYLWVYLRASRSANPVPCPAD